MFEELLAASQLVLRGVDTYLPLPENQLARAAVTRLKDSRTSAFASSITSIYGPAGVGKTHLAHKTLHELTIRNPRLKFAYATCEELCEFMKFADEQQSLAEFLEDCRRLDVLICEDLQTLEREPALQIWLIRLLETLEEGTTQILVTSQKPVGELHPLDQRLVSRCHGGLCVSLSPLGFESRVRFFQHLFQEYGLPILKPMAAAARYLAERLPVSPSELRQAVAEISHVQSRQPMPIDVAYLEHWLASNNRAPCLSFDAILIQVASEFGVSSAELRSRSRNHGLAVPRQCAMWLARELTGRPLNQIGLYFDRSHTTVSHSLMRLNGLLPNAPALRQQVQKLRRQLQELPREDCA